MEVKVEFASDVFTNVASVTTDDYEMPEGFAISGILFFRRNADGCTEQICRYDDIRALHKRSFSLSVKKDQLGRGKRYPRLFGPSGCVPVKKDIFFAADPADAKGEHTVLCISASLGKLEGPTYQMKGSWMSYPKPAPILRFGVESATINEVWKVGLFGCTALVPVAAYTTKQHRLLEEYGRAMDQGHAARTVADFEAAIATARDVIVRLEAHRKKWRAMRVEDYIAMSDDEKSKL